MVSLAVLNMVSGECKDNGYCVIRDVLRDREVIEFKEFMDAGGCANNGGCILKEFALSSGVPDRDFIEGKSIAIFAYEYGIGNRKEARRRWNEEGHAEKFDALYEKGFIRPCELYDAVMGKPQMQFFG